MCCVSMKTMQEEIANLLKELAGLHSRMEELNARAMKPCTRSETPTEVAVADRVLRRAIQKQQLEVTQFHALMSEYALFVSMTTMHLYGAVSATLFTNGTCSLCCRVSAWAVQSTAKSV